MRDRTDIESTMKQYADTVARVCTIYFKNQADRDDAFQETFLKYAQFTGVFEGDEHRKAWLIRVATNTCKDMLKAAYRNNTTIEDIDEGLLEDAHTHNESEQAIQAEELAAALRQLEDKYRDVLYLKFYEGYTAPEIAQILEIPENTVYTNLTRGKEKLKEVLTNDRQ